MRFKLEIEYNGTAYSGWQIQKYEKTIQGELLTASKKLFETEEVEIYGAGRTDAGVHALSQSAHLDVETKLKAEQIWAELNKALPSDIHIISVQNCEPRFHARHDAVMRSYVYQISRRRSAFGKKHIWWVREPLNVKAMYEAAQHLVGFRDFGSFADKNPTEQLSNTVEMRYVDIYEKGDLIVIRVVGSHFLWKMVRRMVGCLVEIGKNNLQIADIIRFTKEETRDPARFTAPAAGLFLEKVYYKNDKINRSLERFMNI
jgi:tRNA pseudouridine38-40 synthase